jgi:metal-sulfur cluster biosynthetic enzyme
MTLTSPNCPVAEILPGEVEMKVREVEGIGDVHVVLVFEPPWDMSMMSEAARLEMGFM